MTRPIDIDHPRTLMLENSVRLPLGSLEPRTVQKTALSLSRFIRENGGTPVGPLVQVIEERVGPDGSPRRRTSLVRQSGSRLAPAGGVIVEDRLEVRDCILARFRGDASDIDIVYAKINVFAYENELPLDGTMYLVFVEENGMTIAVDAFASVDTPGRHADR